MNLLLMLFSGMTYIERRLLAFMQFRLGPNRTGPFGLLQPVADGIKLFFKEEVIPEGANKWIFVAAPAIAIVTAFLSIAVVPCGGTVTIGWGREILLQIADLDIGVLYLFALSSLSVYAIVMAGWAANNKYTLLGGLRSSAQMFSYEIALGLSWVGIIMLAGSFRFGDIVRRAGRAGSSRTGSSSSSFRRSSLPGRGHRGGQPHPLRPARRRRPSSWPGSTPSTRRCASRCCRWRST